MRPEAPGIGDGYGDASGRATITLSFPRIAAHFFEPYAGFVLVLATIFGGGTRHGLWSDVIVQLAALPLLAWALFRLASKKLGGSGRWAMPLLCAIFALPLVHLVPLPPLLWTALPGRGAIASAYQIAGMTLPWLPISLDPPATWRCLLSLIPAVAIFLAMLSLNKPGQRLMVGLILAIAFLNVPLDLLQVMGGDQSPLRFYAITNTDRAVGLFANANHNAALLYCVIPLAVACIAGLIRGHHRNSFIGIVALFILLAAAVIGIALTQSRAGLAIGFLGGLSSLGLLWSLRDRSRSARRILFIGFGVNAIALLIAFQFGFIGLSKKAENADVIGDIRWPAAAVTMNAAIANLPLGSGIGTFVPVYDMFAPRALLSDHYLNHAHNDWIELLLTGGIPAAVIALAFLAWFGRSSFLLWRSDPASGQVLDLALARAASIVIGSLLLHSFVDYPLRSGAVSAVFAVACSLLVLGDRHPKRRAAFKAQGEPAAHLP